MEKIDIETLSEADRKLVERPKKYYKLILCFSFILLLGAICVWTKHFSELSHGGFVFFYNAVFYSAVVGMAFENYYWSRRYARLFDKIFEIKKENGK